MELFKDNFLYFRKELLSLEKKTALKKILIFSQKSFSYISGNETFYIF